MGDEEFSETEIASAERYLVSGEYDGAVTDPVEFLRAQAAADEQTITDLVGPKTEAEAIRRRLERDLIEADTLRQIIARHQRGEVEGLIWQEIRVLATVAHRLGKAANEALGRPTIRTVAGGITISREEVFGVDIKPYVERLEAAGHHDEAERIRSLPANQAVFAEESNPQTRLIDAFHERTQRCAAEENPPLHLACARIEQRHREGNHIDCLPQEDAEHVFDARGPEQGTTEIPRCGAFDFGPLGERFTCSLRFDHEGDHEAWWNDQVKPQSRDEDVAWVWPRQSSDVQHGSEADKHQMRAVEVGNPMADVCAKCGKTRVEILGVEHWETKRQQQEQGATTFSPYGPLSERERAFYANPAPLTLEQRVDLLEETVVALTRTAHRALDIANSSQDWAPGR